MHRYSPYIFLPLLVVLAVVQSSVLNHLRVLEGGWEPLIVAVICWSLLRPEEGIIGAAIAGFFVDLFSGGPFGTTAITWTCVAFLAGQLSGRLWTNNPVFIMLMTMAGSVFAHLLILLQLLLFGYPLDLRHLLAYTTLPTAFINTLTAAPLYLLLRNWHIASLPPILAAEEI